MHLGTQQRNAFKLSLFPGARSALALQFTNVHLTLKWGSVETINHFRAGSGIPCEGQSVNSSSEHQTEHDAAVTKARRAVTFHASAKLKQTV